MRGNPAFCFYMNVLQFSRKFLNIILYFRMYLRILITNVEVVDNFVIR